MSNLKRCLLLLVALICFGCREPSPEESFKKERDERIYSALRKFTKSMHSKGYHAVGIGEGIDHATGKQSYIKVVLDIDSLPSIEFAREIELEAIQEFLECINSEPGIEEYVAEYPYPTKFLQVIFVRENSENGLFSVGNYGDVLRYTEDDPENPMGLPREVHREPYDLALNIHSQNKKGV